MSDTIVYKAKMTIEMQIYVDSEHANPFEKLCERAELGAQVFNSLISDDGVDFEVGDVFLKCKKSDIHSVEPLQLSTHVRLQKNI